MADRCRMCLLRLIILCPLLTGTSGAEETHVFSSSGESVSLPCNNALSDCTSTTWNYNNDKDSETVELIGELKKNDIERRERLSLGSDCSLNIKKVTHEDYGLYTCRQYVNKQQQGTDAPVNLHVLHISSSSSETEIRSGSVTLSCQLYLYRVSCDTLVRSGLQLIWVNQSGVNLMTDSRYKILSSPHCISSLTTTRLNEDPNREFRCQVTQNNQMKTSATYTVKFSAPKKTLTTVPSSKTTPTVNKPTSTSTQPVSPLKIAIFAVSAALAVLLPAVILWVVCKKRGDIKRETNDSVVKNMNKYNGTKDKINISIHHTASANERKDVIYTEIATFSKNQDKNNKVHGDDKVTYASIRGATAGLQDNCSQL